MTEQVERKGMSKGCLVALIIVGVLVVLIAIAGITCYMNRDALVKYGAVTMVTGVRGMMIDKPVEGVDTTVVFAVTAAFIEKLQADETIETEKLTMFIQSLQPLVTDETVGVDDAQQLIELMVEMYPELGDMVPVTPEETVTDSIGLPAEGTVSE